MTGLVEDSVESQRRVRSPALQVRGAHKRYGRTVALDELDLAVRPGEWVGLIGPNGAGKTTLIHAVAGLLALDAGSVTVGDHPPGPGAPLGLVPQEIAVYPHLSARENLDAFARFHGLTGNRLRQRVEWALDWTGLTGRAGQLARELSGGMRRRLNIACGVLHRPPLVLLDEPTVGVDPQGRARIWAMLDDLRAEGASLVQSSHQLDEIQARCDRMVVVDHGRVLAEGTLSQLAQRAALSTRSVRITLRGEIPDVKLPAGLIVEGGCVVGTLDDAVREIPALLQQLTVNGASVEDLHVEPPRLEEVFARLTGTELRE